MNDEYNEKQNIFFTAIDKVLEWMLYRLPDEILLLLNVPEVADMIREERNPSIIVQSELPPPAFDTEEELDEAMSNLDEDELDACEALGIDPRLFE